MPVAADTDMAAVWRRTGVTVCLPPLAEKIESKRILRIVAIRRILFALVVKRKDFLMKLVTDVHIRTAQQALIATALYTCDNL